MRAKCNDGPRKQRAVSEGALSFSSLFSTAAPEPSTEGKTSKHQARVGSVGAKPWGAGRDLPSLLQQVSLKGRRDSGGVFSDDMASLPGKKLNLFASLRLKKREESESEGRDQEIKTILTNLRNKASSQQNLDEPSSSDDEDENLTSNQKRCPERQRRKQEKTVAQQSKREQLKRLHRAQVPKPFLFESLI
ncbi:protein-methionine sulfoxide oxidase mical2b-like [Notothenia coriiceps]|uniref:Protein-methionine sulfoxide oxidase mical2b-like n=1 Tax=Notothenia coriiceps TaxID=8208 RepID=A0A6I9PAS9_9TELE|nr:PREDICTED: protein-methionine sulfoxide oxidase mical2b-like [Notothenia coriiceps]